MDSNQETNWVKSFGVKVMDEEQHNILRKKEYYQSAVSKLMIDWPPSNVGAIIIAKNDTDIWKEITEGHKINSIPVVFSSLLELGLKTISHDELDDWAYVLFDTPTFYKYRKEIDDRIEMLEERVTNRYYNGAH